MSHLQVFPFFANKYLANDVWRSWHAKNREMLDREYGSIGFVGDETAKQAAARGHGIYTSFGHLKSFSCYQVDMEIVSETEVKFYAYGMADAVYGGRGDLENTFTATLKPQTLAEAILKRKQNIAEHEYERRLAAAAEEARRKAIQVVFNELFTESV